MGKFFDKFPKIAYDIQGADRKEYQFVTNIFFRLRVLRSVLNNTSSYYEYIIQEFDTPEILAEKLYRDAQAHWIILLANDIVDPHYDWPMNSRTFKKYIIGKYGSISNSKITYHHYEKVVSRYNSFTDVTSETRFVVNEDQYTDDNLTVPYDTYENLTDVQSVSTYNLEDGRTVVETIYRDRISNYDYENALNESKRTIKVIRPEYYSQILLEFQNLTATTRLRRIV